MNKMTSKGMVWEPNQIPPRNPAKSDPLIKQLKKAYRGSALYEVDKLFVEQSRWLRKRTIAENKLADVRRRLDAKLKELATPQPETPS